MVNYSSSLDHTFAALADPIRRSMLDRLAHGEASVGELAAPHGISLPAVLKHVRALERVGLVAARKEGRVRVCRLVPRPLASAAQWLRQYEQFWTSQLDSLDRFLTGTASEVSPWTPSAPPPTSRSKSADRSRPTRRDSSRRGRKRTR